jgi:tRNA threonylcarbamoyladenosine biosynthesis protein TsaE
MINVHLPDVAATMSIAAKLVAALPANTQGCMLLLQGELGAGKSTLARAMLRELGHCGPVPSPTYTLVEPYELSGGIVYHIDLYRISGTEELDFLGWSDLRDGLILLEWPERVPQLVEQADLKITLEYGHSGHSGDSREASFQSYSTLGSKMMQRFAIAS